MLAPAINTLGLLCDIAGVVMLFKFAVNRNPTLSPEGHVTGYIEGNESDELAKRKYWRYKKAEDVGLLLLILGFSVQAVATWLSYTAR